MNRRAPPLSIPTRPRPWRLGAAAAAALAGLAGGCVAVAPPEEAGGVAVAVEAAPATADAEQSRPEAPPDVARHSTESSSATAGVRASDVVVAARSLSGYWRVNGPAYVDLEGGLLKGIRIIYGAERQDRNICQIEDRGGQLASICSAGMARTGSGSAEGDSVALQWWDGPATVIFHGRKQGPDTIEGILSGGMLGIRVTGGIPVTLARLEPDAAPESAGAARVREVLEDVRARRLTPGRYGPEAIAHITPTLSHPPVAAPPIHVSFLGTIHIRWRKRQADKVQDVYRVDTADATALCRIAESADGKVQDFDCRSPEL